MSKLINKAKGSMTSHAFNYFPQLFYPHRLLNNRKIFPLIIRVMACGFRFYQALLRSFKNCSMQLEIGKKVIWMKLNFSCGECFLHWISFWWPFFFHKDCYDLESFSHRFDFGNELAILNIFCQQGQIANNFSLVCNFVDLQRFYYRGSFITWTQQICTLSSQRLRTWGTILLPLCSS